MAAKDSPHRRPDWTTDLTSVPAFLTWLVPKTGAHLPAAILHDGLVLAKGEPDRYRAGRPPIRRDQADRIFRDAMIATGTPPIRAWLVWAAVTAAIVFHGRQVDWSPALRWYYRGVLCATMAAIIALASGRWWMWQASRRWGWAARRSVCPACRGSGSDRRGG